MISQRTLDIPATESLRKQTGDVHESILQYRSFTSAFILILAAVLSAFLIQHMGKDLFSVRSPGTWGSLLILFVWVGAAIHFRRELFWILTSYQFAVSILASSSIAVIIGTFIIQHGSFAEYANYYGPLIAQLIQSFFLFDLFHSLWFASLLLLTALSLLMVLLKRNPFRLTQLGFLLSHGGIILIIGGAIAGYFYSEAGMIHLLEGQSASSVALAKNGEYSGKTRDLGFALQLQDFQVSYYPAEFKLYAYRLAADQKEYRAVGSYKLKQGKQYSIPGSDTTVVIQSAEVGDIARVAIQAHGANGFTEATLTSQKSAPVYLNDGQIALVIDKRDQEAKEYRSFVSVLENNSEITRSEIAVNHPLKYKGFTFYQANFDPERPAYSGIQMVKDPGLGVVYVGFTMMSMGVIFIFYIRPKLVDRGRKRQEADHAA